MIGVLILFLHISPSFGIIDRSKKPIEQSYIRLWSRSFEVMQDKHKLYVFDTEPNKYFMHLSRDFSIRRILLKSKEKFKVKSAIAKIYFNGTAFKNDGEPEFYSQFTHVYRNSTFIDLQRKCGDYFGLVSHGNRISLFVELVEDTDRDNNFVLFEYEIYGFQMYETPFNLALYKPVLDDFCVRYGVNTIAGNNQKKSVHAVRINDTHHGIHYKWGVDLGRVYKLKLIVIYFRHFWNNARIELRSRNDSLASSIVRYCKFDKAQNATLRMNSLCCDLDWFSMRYAVVHAIKPDFFPKLLELRLYNDLKINSREYCSGDGKMIDFKPLHSELDTSEKFFDNLSTNYTNYFEERHEIQSKSMLILAIILLVIFFACLSVILIFYFEPKFFKKFLDRHRMPNYVRVWLHV